MNILIASVFTILLLSVFHLARLLWWVEMWMWLRFVLGVLGLVLPLTWLLVEWQSWQALSALWIIVVSGGITVLLWFGIEEMTDKQRRNRQAEERESALAERVRNATQN